MSITTVQCLRFGFVGSATFFHPCSKYQSETATKNNVLHSKPKTKNLKRACIKTRNGFLRIIIFKNKRIKTRYIHYLKISPYVLNNCYF